MKNVLFLLFFFILANLSGQVIYLEGEYPVLITVPHNGPFDDPLIPNSNAKNDLHTRAIAYAIHSMSIIKPHVVVFENNRRDVDVNRPSDGSLEYQAYHKALEDLMPEINLLIDLHGHTHPHQLIEVGYDIPHENINNRQYSPNLKYQHFSLSQSDILFDFSLANHLSYPAFPSRNITFLPIQTNQYFNGGYTVETYGSASTLAIQLELPQHLRFNNNNKLQFCQEMAEYLPIYYETIKWNRQ